MKKAWARENEMMFGAKPIMLEEDEQDWKFAEQIETIENTLLRMKWKSNVPGSNAPERVIIGAIQDMENMGYDVSDAEQYIDEGLELLSKDDFIGLNRVTWRIWKNLNEAKKIEGHPYHSYTVYDSFEKYKNDITPLAKYNGYDVSASDFFDKTYYGWLAQICAGALGTAIEGYTTEQLRKEFGEIYGYVRTPNTYNDDITYEVAFLQALERTGKELTSGDIAEEWTALIPFGWSAEEWALKNIKSGIYPPQSGFMNNPYREWIGAQMRGAVCGMVMPGNALETARLAFMDGVVSHHNNGVLGEVFNAVMVSMAYVENDVKTILQDAFNYIPKNSEYFSVIDFALQACKNNSNWEDAWKLCREKFKKYNWIHAYPNVAAEVVALWFGGNDFDEVMHIIAMIGYDVDCNAAQIATVLGIINKEKTCQEKWTAPFGDEIKTYIRGSKTMSLKALAEKTVKLAKLIK